MQIATERLCREYAWRDAHELLTDTRAQLRSIAGLLDGGRDRELLVQAGWLTLLAGCVEYDTGRYPRAERSRRAAARLGQETGHGEITAWSFEMSAWFALTRGDVAAVGPLAQAGMETAPHSSVAVQLAAQAAKAAARMGDANEVDRLLEHGHRLLGEHDRPSRPENHFVVDPRKWDFFAMDCYRLLGDDRRATEHAHEVLRISRRPDGTDSSPMRATEARLTMAVVSVRRGDLDAAATWTNAALGARRKSVEQLVMITDELRREVRRLYPGDPASRLVTEPIDRAVAAG
ncbi:hypothetical protein AOZ06_19535 [Kibdelosporangium phytohabitans]|uniref:XRE family transcriptional regulator n=1 Tax=Kibdelosporangium phytohabitans TaxID=860235 RepID=A0A0N9IEE5_9PSEU|nr:hypothetical protein AOZ06_19535 [Kibdelosporangium phytohabitans]